MNILFLGDVTARSGRMAVIRRLPSLQQETEADFTILNGENAAHGKGITSTIYRELMEAGADVITLGNHMFSKREILDHMEDCPYLIRPANQEPLTPGRSFVVKECRGKRVAVISLSGRIFMDNVEESPCACMERLLPAIDADLIIADLHAEATAEKELFLHCFKDRLSAVIGTHTHVQTADERILGGCAYISDAGMCGPWDSILGRDPEEVVSRMIHGEKTHYRPSENPAVISGVLIRTDDRTNRALSIERIQERPY